MTYLVRSIEHVHGEEPKVEVLSTPGVVIQLRKRHKNVVVDNTVEETHGDDWQDRPERVPEEQEGVLEVAKNRNE